jgi:ataxin-3
MSHQVEVWIYHELQDSMLCGQHALNNLIQQQNFFDPGQLAEIAHQLDAQERDFMGGNLNEPSGNVDAQGNFSIQVITNALSNVGIDLTVWNMRRLEAEPSLEVGFIVNRDAHWFSVRKINGKWWDLNSAKETPEPISEFYLGAFLSQLSSDGYSVFVARGHFPQPSSDRDEKGPFWHLESSMTKNNSAVVVNKFEGKGNKLGDYGIFGSTNEEDDDEELARAIALSVVDMTSSDATSDGSGSDRSQAASSSSSTMTEKEKIRAKRLAAMGL